MFAWFKKSPPQPDAEPVSDARAAPGALRPAATEESGRLKNMGDAYLHAGKYADAAQSYRSALVLRPDFIEAHFYLGVVLQTLGQLDTAAASFSRALELKPDLPEAHFNLGNVLIQMGRTSEAAACFRETLALRPDFAGAHCNLGNLLREQGQPEASVDHFRRALQLAPDLYEAHCNLGGALQALGQTEDAVASFRRALRLAPDFYEAHNNLGCALTALGQADEAVASFRQAQALAPDFHEAHNNLGNAQRLLGRLDEAVASCRRALELKPDYAEAHSNLGSALRDLGQYDDAVASCRQALAIKPDLAEAHCNLGVIQQYLGQLDEAAASFVRVLQIKPDLLDVHSSLLFLNNYRPGLSAATLLAEAQKFGGLAAKKARPYRDWSNSPEVARRLCVGLVSGDLCKHAAGYFIEGVAAALAAGEADHLDLIAYPTHSLSDELTERVKASCHGWHPAAGLSDENLAGLIHRDGIDILIDLSGHTTHNRLLMFAWKPAPVQVSWLGYFGTTGVAAIDYLLADPWTLPESEEVYFTEKIWRLPETRLCFTPPDIDVEVSPLPALENGYITFGCFNNLTKMNQDVITTWSRVLASVPNSRLFLKSKQLKEASVQQYTLKCFADNGIDSNRIILEGSESRTKYLEAYHRVDISLDPFPYPGGTTSVEGLWMGAPVLTLDGGHFLSRQGVGIMMNAGLQDWIAADADDYVARAVRHATDLQALSDLRDRLRRQVLQSPLFDAPRFAKNFAAAMRGMWARWCEQQR
jgi:protein O-GlcNAc transferase